LGQDKEGIDLNLLYLGEIQGELAEMENTICHCVDIRCFLAAPAA
jgi:hypothetical protein